MEIVPAIDIMNGECVRLLKGDFERKSVYGKNPVDTAVAFEQHGLSRLHLVDLDGARMGKIHNLDVLKKIARNTHLTIDFGGGIRSREDIQQCLDSGATYVNVGTSAVTDRSRFVRWLDDFGADRIIVSADVQQDIVRISGWARETQLKLEDFLADMAGQGIRRITCTDIDRDGVLSGPAVNLYAMIIDRFPQLSLTASGGISSLADLDQLKKVGCSAAIIGKAIYESKISLPSLAKWMENAD
jgi:phosphoribosylformimino-5-aminoimidazole carboxamide ribotide isomerase